MKKRINMEPIKVAHAPADTYLLSLLLPHKESWGWIASNFISISLRKKNYWDEFYRYEMWAGCPFILETALTREIAELVADDFLDFTCQVIDRGYCIYTSVNRYPIKMYDTEQMNLCHNPLIFGYDKKEKKFNVAEFYNRHFSFVDIPFEELESAFKMYPLVFENHPHKKTRLIKFYNNPMYRFSIEDLIEKIKEYINGENLYRKFHQGFYRSGFSFDSTYCDEFEFGINYYNLLKIMVNAQTELDVRPFQMLVFKNEVSRFRHDFLKNLGIQISCDKELDDLQKMTLILRNLVIKCNVSKNNLKNNIIKLIGCVQETDKYYCEKLIANLEKEKNNVVNL